MTDKALEAAYAVAGEAEVVAWAYRGPRGGLIVTEEKPKHAPEAVPLVTLASLQAMQARAEKAERERDDAVGKGERQWAGWVKEEVARKAAEARVKELEEALGQAEAEASKGLDTGETRDALIDIKFTARTALKGDKP